mgnify:CR=1 FL=1
MELYKTDGTKNRWNFFESKKNDGTFPSRFLMDKKHPAPGTGFHRQNYYERNSHCKNVIVMY